MIWQKGWFGNFQNQKLKLLQNVQFLTEVDALVIILSASFESHDSTDNQSLLSLAQWSKVLIHGRNIYFGYVWKK